MHTSHVGHKERRSISEIHSSFQTEIVYTSNFVRLEARACSVIFDSQQDKRLLQEDTRMPLCLRTVQECISDCIKEAKNSEIICLLCIGFNYLIEAWENMRSEARRNGESCSCPECVPGSKWFAASEDLFAWRQ